MILDNSKYNFHPFDLEKALAGKPLAAQFGTSGGQPVRKLVEQFYRESSDFALYKVLVESTYYTFNSDGIGTVDVEGTPTNSILEMCEGIIDDTGSSQNPGDVIPYTPSGGDTEYFYIPSLNFRETVAVHALNSIISHYDNPIGYNTASIKLMITKAFEFAVEFTNQALDFRKKDEEAGITPGGETIIPDTPEVAVLKEIKSAFIGGTEQNPVKLIDQVTSMKSALINESTNPATSILTKMSDMDAKLSAIANGLYDNTTTPATTVLTKLDEIVDALGNSVDAQTIADGIDQSSALQAIHGVLATDTNNIQSDVHSIATETNVIREALHNPNNANDTIFGRVQGIGNDTDVIRTEVSSSNSALWGINVDVEDIKNHVVQNP